MTCLAPRHVVRPLLTAGDDDGVGRDLAQPASVEIDDGRVALGRKAVVHRLVVDLEVADTVRLGMSVARAHLPPRGRGRIVDVVHPVHRVFDRCRTVVGRRQHDQRIGAELARQLQVLVGAEAVVIGVATPYFVGVVHARGERPDAVLPLVGGGKRPTGPADERGRQSAQRREEVGTQHAALAHVRAHHRHEVDEHSAASSGGDLDRRVAIAPRAREREGHFLPRRSARREWQIGQHVAIRRQHAQ